MNFLASTSPEEGWKELHDYAAKHKFDKGWHYNTRGRPYYMIKKKKRVRFNLLFINCLIVSRKTMRDYLLSGHFSPVFKTDFSRYAPKQFHAALLVEVCDFNDIYIQLKHVTTVAHTSRCTSSYILEDFTVVSQLDNKEYPEGYATMSNKKEGTFCEMDVPESVKRKLREKALPIQLKKAQKRKVKK